MGILPSDTQRLPIVGDFGPVIGRDIRGISPDPEYRLRPDYADESQHGPIQRPALPTQEKPERQQRNKFAENDDT